MKLCFQYFIFVIYGQRSQERTHLEKKTCLVVCSSMVVEAEILIFIAQIFFMGNSSVSQSLRIQLLSNFEELIYRKSLVFTGIHMRILKEINCEIVVLPGRTQYALYKQQFFPKVGGKIVNAAPIRGKEGGNERRFQKLQIIEFHLIISVPGKMMEDLIKFG